MNLDPLAWEAPGAGTTGLGGFNLGGVNLRGILQALMPQQDRRAMLQERLLELQIAAAVRGKTTPYAAVPFESLPMQRADWVFVGERGAGKTAGAVAIAQRYQLPILAVDWPTEAAAAIGARPVTWSTAERAKDSVLLLDEAHLRSTPTEALFRCLALARHANVSVVYTTQTTAALSRDVLRMDPVLAWKRPGSVGAMFEREELLEIAAAARIIHESLNTHERPGVTALYQSGRWLVTELPLPNGWTEEVSKLWRR